MNNAFSCSTCGPIEKTTTVQRGNSGLAIVLWLIAIIPGILLFIEPRPVYYFGLGFVVPSFGYSVWRCKSGYTVCTKCKTPLDSNWQPENRPAVGGLIFGLMLHVPLISGIIARILGVIGRRRAKSLQGQGLSIANLALILGVLNIAGWLLISISMSLAWCSEPPPLPAPPCTTHNESSSSRIRIQ